MEQVKKVHYSYIDLLRIVSTLAVVVIHVFDSSMNNATFVLGDSIRTFSELLHAMLNFIVPIFLMITGFLFLGNNKSYTYRDMTKYLGRVFSCLILFGASYSLLEQIFLQRTLRFSMFGTALLDILSGHLWDHMWYLYMLVGIYLLLPVIKAFKLHCSSRDFLIFTGIVFVFNCLIPTITDATGFSIGFSLPLKGMYLFYLLAGGFLASFRPKRMWVYPLIYLGCVGLILCSKLTGLFSLGTDDSSLVVCVMSIALFLSIQCFSRNYMSGKIVTILQKASWGVYLIHPLFLNLIIKFFRWNPLQGHPVAYVALTSALLFLGCSLVVWLLQKIKFVRVYFL